MFLAKFFISFVTYCMVIAASTIYANKIGTPDLRDLLLYKRSSSFENSKHDKGQQYGMNISNDQQKKERLVRIIPDSYEDMFIFKRNSDYFDFENDYEHHYDTTIPHDQQNDYSQDSQPSGSDTVPIYFQKKHFHHGLRSNDNDGRSDDNDGRTDSGKEQKSVMSIPNDQQNNESQESQQSGSDTKPISLRKKHHQHGH